jgi:hypothetical protein
VTRARTVVAVLAAVMLLGSSCAETGGVSPQRTAAAGPTAFALSGQLLGTDGRTPAVDLPVVLTGEPGVAQSLFGVLVFGLTLGLSCLAAVTPCSRSSRTRTDANGRFSFDLDQSGLNKVTGGATGVEISAGVAPGGPTVVAEFKTAPRIVLPALELWDPHLAIQRSGTIGLFRWTGPQSPSGRPGSRLRLTDDRGGTVAAATANGGDASSQLDLRALEDTSGPAALDASSSASGSSGKIKLSWLAAPTRYPAIGPVPFSRDAACTLDGRPTSPCPVTDGDLTTPTPLGTTCISTPSLPPAGSPPTTRPCVPSVGHIDIDLGSPRYVGLLTVHGSGVVLVSTSTDGQTWRPARRTTTSVSLGGAAAWAPAGSRARYVRVEQQGNLPAPVAEVSAWPPERALTVPEVPQTGPGLVPVQQVASAPHHSKRSSGLIVLAILAALALAAAAFLAGRHTRRPAN